MSPKVRVRPDGASRAVAYAKVILAGRLENPFNGADNCYILYQPDIKHMKSDSLAPPTSDNIFYAGIFRICKSRFADIQYQSLSARVPELSALRRAGLFFPILFRFPPAGGIRFQPAAASRQ